MFVRIYAVDLSGSNVAEWLNVVLIEGHKCCGFVLEFD